jgi:hypothetical protein
LLNSVSGRPWWIRRAHGLAIPLVDSHAAGRCPQWIRSCLAAGSSAVDGMCDRGQTSPWLVHDQPIAASRPQPGWPKAGQSSAHRAAFPTAPSNPNVTDRPRRHARWSPNRSAMYLAAITDEINTRARRDPDLGATPRRLDRASHCRWVDPFCRRRSLRDQQNSGLRAVVAC